jgi:hypothetical protein
MGESRREDSRSLAELDLLVRPVSDKRDVLGYLNMFVTEFRLARDWPYEARLPRLQLSIFSED